MPDTVGTITTLEERVDRLENIEKKFNLLLKKLDQIIELLESMYNNTPSDNFLP